MFNKKPYQEKIDQAFEFFESELRKIRTGRAHPGMLDGVLVEAYGSKMPLNQVANVTAPEAQMLLVTPFDPSNVVAITTGIRDSHLGFNPSDDGKVVRVPIPSLTEERRRDLVKQVGEKVEEARIAMRNIRQEAQKEVKRMKDDKEIGEDEFERTRKEIDEMMDGVQAKIEEIFQAKEKDVLTV